MILIHRFLFYFSTMFMLIGISCSPVEKDVADTILANGKIITVDSDFSIFEAVAVKDGKILDVGTDKDIRNLAGTETGVIDLRGHTVIPGIIEGHLHPILASQSELFDEIPDLHTIDELLNWVAGKASKKQEGEWIIHPKFFATRMMKMRPPSIEELDSVAPDNPVFLNGSYGGTINSKALVYSGITNPEDHPGILKDTKTGLPNGLITAAAFKLLKLPEKRTLTADEKLAALKHMLHLYNQVGITSVCSGIGTTENFNLYKALLNKGGLTVRVYQNIRIPFSPHATPAEMQMALDSLGYMTGDGDEWVKIGALKATIDGGILTGTAFLREPWGVGSKDIYGITDPEYRGVLMISKDELVNMISVAAKSGWKFTSHVTGGGGVDTLLAAYQEVNEEIPIIDRRFSIIHGNFFNHRAIKIMSDLGVYAEMQPAWYYKDADLLNRVLGEQRIKTFHPYRSLFDAGVVVNGGSDHMVKLDPYTSINPYNPFLSMWSIVARKTERGSNIVPEEALTRKQALRMYTINNAWESFDEKNKGTIEPGKFADMAVLSQDILTCPEDSIKAIKVLMTMVDGEIVYEAGGIKN